MAIKVYTGNAKLPEWTLERADRYGRAAYRAMAAHDWYGREHQTPAWEDLSEEDRDACPTRLHALIAAAHTVADTLNR